MRREATSKESPNLANNFGCTMKIILFTIITVLITACSSDNSSEFPKPVFLAQHIEYERDIEIWNKHHNKSLFSFKLQIEKLSRNAIIAVYSEGEHYNLQTIRDFANENQAVHFNNWEPRKELSVFNEALNRNTSELHSIKHINKAIQLLALAHEPIAFPFPSPDKNSKAKPKGRTEEGCMYNFDDFSGLLINYRCGNVFDPNISGFEISIEKISKVGGYWLPLNAVVRVTNNRGEAGVFYLTARRTKIGSM